ncbi:hypothetical protein PIB30_006856 [Stylosanthes scabra]|uniref:Uncharacterized protein n=1 Tax=Stylosanthes scabra TaxID=79078 RepID=A0ABU6V5V5_9FABA|nr:hypothetical protein [Stylosanthes scabra]
MRLPKLKIVVMCLLLFIACIGSNTIVARNNYVLDAAKMKKNKTPIMISDTLINKSGVHNKECNHKKKEKKKRRKGQHQQFSNCSEKNTTLDDGKRVVPTGPNPLHNR